MPAGRYAVLHVEASTPLKHWEEAKWLSLAGQLSELNIQPVWSAGPAGAALLQRIDPAGRFPALGHTLDLPQLWHLVAGAALLVCPDTSVMHIGRLTGTPTVALFGPSSAPLFGRGRILARGAVPRRHGRRIFPAATRTGSSSARSRGSGAASARSPNAPRRAACTRSASRRRGARGGRTAAMTRVLLNFRGGFAGLREGFEALGCEVIENQWAPERAALDGTALCVADFVDCARRVRRSSGSAAAARARARAVHRAQSRRAVQPRRASARASPPCACSSPSTPTLRTRCRRPIAMRDRVLYCPNAARESRLPGIGGRARRHARSGAVPLGRDLFRQPGCRPLRGARAARGIPAGARAEARRTWESATPVPRQRGHCRPTSRSRSSERAGSTFLRIAACDAGAEPSWGLPERCYGVPACGGFLLSDRRRHAAEDFADDERAEYDGLDDCVRKIRHLPGALRRGARHRRARAGRASPATTATGTAPNGC